MCSHQAHIGNWIKAGLKHSKVHVPKRAHWLRFSAEAEGERERERRPKVAGTGRWLP